ncbi:hypothetical protein HYPBUDRAFT_193804 [Hyphopichia burtonii NRRL Y-1933]|uniref:Uncharacterized protein n=1 Tax=Hyphopichia burtonii NRRL Y-1933 TaxID=984485 RepID=A0A1E4RP51_9ASCO|nr:hypothetical protein HYPBUDRAFT_193804 [Hyphopichia burtonii NRRL Y-1933]ODV69029.1 hypothetical protein HYPBUDRAFT_193804 [Hyphopichia burtonii NRRL Y-1933]
MSEGKSFQSTSVKHIGSYPLVKSVSDFLLSFSLLNYFYQELYHFIGIFNSNISKVEPIYNGLVFLDANFDRMVLSRLDSVIAKTPDLSAYHPVTIYTKSVVKLNKDWLKPTNESIYKTYDAYLPGSLTENKTSFKIDAVTKDETKIGLEISHFVEISNEFLNRLKYYITGKSNDVSEALINTYNSEYEKLDATNPYFKSGQASYKTGLTLINDVKSDYFVPLKNQVNDVASQTKTRINNSINLNLQQVEEKKNELINGTANPPVSASA